jgi:uncharacterized protein YbaA (DUF1428 family)
MTFVEGFLTPVPTAHRERYLAHARKAVPLFRSLGASRFVECWGDDVPDGKLNDLKQAVALAADETVLFSWIEYPDRAARDAANERMMADPAAADMMKDLPFDAGRMIYAGFAEVLDTGAGEAPGYVDGYVLPVRDAGREHYAQMARTMADRFRDYGALRIFEGWGDDVPAGERTDYHRATRREEGETVVYSFVEWPDKETRNAGWARLMADDPFAGEEPPFDGKRMMWGGFQPILVETYA